MPNQSSKGRMFWHHGTIFGFSEARAYVSGGTATSVSRRAAGLHLRGDAPGAAMAMVNASRESPGPMTIQKRPGRGLGPGSVRTQPEAQV